MVSNKSLHLKLLVSSFPPFQTAEMSRLSDTCHIVTGQLFFLIFVCHYPHFKKIHASWCVKLVLKRIYILLDSKINIKCTLV
ncbi:hypothetical protein MtrunA17_Chr2g0310271 [Medicago truncatula]|uniref:Uncharacterized protein n=1 Tax=Medicago truncatula TaxID=3880 RepID=A0A396J831_MEDTR|nr:hypothetical protein MtrunA17_Chr2g0310271 [Medicago truncatula]